ncbi:MAG: hypothetical protein JWN70_1330 [Planctomycetaceae bacterium]|nr:hypothetical protein [Planctomycetaceae bacterium]
MADEKAFEIRPSEVVEGHFGPSISEFLTRGILPESRSRAPLTARREESRLGPISVPIAQVSPRRARETDRSQMTQRPAVRAVPRPSFVA